MSKYLAAIALAVASLSANAATIHSLGDQLPTGFSTNNYFSGNARGWEFTVGVAGISVSELGIAPVSGGSYTLSLWDVASQTVLAQTTLSNVNGEHWNWASLATPVALTAGASYLVVGIGNGSDQSYYYKSGLPASWYPTGDINYFQMVYCNSCSANTYPTQTLSNYQYGVVDIGYTVNAVPEPSTYAMLGLGMLVVGVALRKKSA